MARIRSVHPGLFTDEAFAFLSDAAQVLLIGIWTECDDQGAFEWKPGMLRMRLRPGKDGSLEPLLEELVTAECIMSYEHAGRTYGLVRNFQRFQRPKKPNCLHFIPPEFRTYVGSRQDSSEPEDDEANSVPKKAEQMPVGGRPVPQKSEKSPQMEDGGCIGEVGTRARDPDANLEHQLREAAGWLNEPAPNLAVTGEIQALISNGADLHADVLPTVRALAPRASSRTSWRYFVKAIARARDNRIEASTIVSPPSSNGVSHASTRKKPSRREFFESLHAGLDRAERGAGEDGDRIAADPAGGTP